MNDFFKPKSIMITGFAGFIGSNFTRYWLKKYPKDFIIGIDNMTYAARPDWALDEALKTGNKERFKHIIADISDPKEIRRVIKTIKPDHIIHFAAESHVTKSIEGPKDFIYSNIIGTYNLLKEFSDLGNGGRFHHISTDEVYGQLPFDEKEKFHELRPYAPTSPYSASKASSDHLVNAWHHTYGLDTVITNSSNNFGPNQHPEKLVPKTIMHAMGQIPMTLHGSGDHRRDWLYVDDHVSAIDFVFNQGVSGESYCIGGDMELSNKDMVDKIHAILSKTYGVDPAHLKIVHNNDRPTDDQRYSVDCAKLKKLGWSPNPHELQSNLESTVAWYFKLVASLSNKKTQLKVVK